MQTTPGVGAASCPVRRRWGGKLPQSFRKSLQFAFLPKGPSLPSRPAKPSHRSGEPTGYIEPAGLVHWGSGSVSKSVTPVRRACLHDHRSRRPSIRKHVQHESRQNTCRCQRHRGYEERCEGGAGNTLASDCRAAGGSWTLWFQLRSSLAEPASSAANGRASRSNHSVHIRSEYHMTIS